MFPFRNSVWGFLGHEKVLKKIDVGPDRTKPH